MIRFVCWNMGFKRASWRVLAGMDADIALVQEPCRPPVDVARQVDTGPNEHWDATNWNSEYWQGRFPHLADRVAKVVRLSDRVRLEWYRQVGPISTVKGDEIAVSGIGTIAAARVVPLQDGLPPLIAVSMYARWFRAHPTTGSKWSVGYSDGSAHRILSDLSAFIGSADPATHRILAAGDLNIVDGSQTGNPQDLEERNQGVFSRIDALGLALVRLGGRQAEPRPAYLPPDTRNVPTYYTTGERCPQNATKQLDYVFASKGLHRGVSARALNGVDEWGPSDHCRLAIDVN